MIDFNQFSTLTISIHTPVILVLYFVLTFYAIFTGVFYYHWNAYSSDKKVTMYTFAAYFGTTIPLLMVMGILAALI